MDWIIKRDEIGRLVLIRRSDGLVEYPLYDVQTGKLIYAFPDEIPPDVKRRALRYLTT